MMGSEIFDRSYDRRGSHSLKWDKQQRAGGSNDSLAMWVADADFGISPAVDTALRQRLKLPLGYSFISDAYLDSVCSWLARRHGWEVEVDWLVPVHSTMSAMALAVEVCTAKGDGVCIQPPIYPPFFQLAGKDRRLTINPLTLTNEGYRLDVQQLARMLAHETKILALCHPHNPSGRNWQTDELTPLVDLCLKNDVYLLTDAIHCDLVWGGQPYVFPFQISSAIAERSITLISPNKSFNIAGISSATAIIPDKNLRRRFCELARYYHLNELGTLAQLAAEQAYRHDAPWLDQMLLYLAENQRYLLDFIQRETPLIRACPCEATYLIFLDCRKLGSEEQMAHALREAKLTLQPGHHFGPQAKGFFRLNFATSRSTLAEGLARLHQAYQRVK